MLNSTAINWIMRLLAGRTAEQTRLDVVFQLNEKIRELEIGPVKPHFLEKVGTGVFVVDQDYIDLPADFIEEYEEDAFRFQDAEAAWYTPKKAIIEHLRAEYDGVDSAAPEAYAVYGDRMYLGATPDYAYTYRLLYYGHTDPVVDDDQPITNQWLLRFFNYTTLEVALHIAATILQSAEIVAKLAPVHKQAFDRFWRSVESRKIANMDPLLGNTED